MQDANEEVGIPRFLREAVAPDCRDLYVFMDVEGVDVDLLAAITR